MESDQWDRHPLYRCLPNANSMAFGVRCVLAFFESSDGLFKYESEGWALAKGLVSASSDTFIRKTASDSFHQTVLHATLQERV